jgi:Flp pilus assembly protein TadD
MKKIINIIGVLIFTVTINAQQKGNEVVSAQPSPFQATSKNSLPDVPLVSKEAEELNNRGIAKSLTEGNFEAAEKLFRQAVESDFRCFQCRYNLGMSLSSQEKYTEAIQVFKDLISYKPDYALAFAGLAEAYDKKGLYRESVEVYRKAVKLAPNDVIFLTNLGNALSKVEECEEALTYLNKAIKLNDRMAAIYNNRATVLFALERYREAVDDLKRAITLQPDSPQIHNNLGVMLGAMGKEKEARIYYSEALRLHPGWNVALYNLALSHLISGDQASARQNVSELEKVDPLMAEKARKAVLGKYIVNVSDTK